MIDKFQVALSRWRTLRNEFNALPVDRFTYERWIIEDCCCVVGAYYKSCDDDTKRWLQYDEVRTWPQIQSPMLDIDSICEHFGVTNTVAKLIFLDANHPVLLDNKYEDGPLVDILSYRDDWASYEVLKTHLLRAIDYVIDNFEEYYNPGVFLLKDPSLPSYSNE
jgi:hypothetical protein